MPNAAAVVCTLMPLHMPIAVTMAAFLPRDRPWAITKVLSDRARGQHDGGAQKRKQTCHGHIVSLSA